MLKPPVLASNLDRIDVRVGGSWTSRQALKNAVIYACIRAGLALSDRLPQAALRWLYSLMGRVVSRCATGLRRRAFDRLRAVYDPETAHALSRRCLVHAVENLALTLLLRRADVRALELVEVPDDALSTLRQALSSGGVVFVSAHLGPFEALAAAIAELGLRPAVVVRESYDPRLNGLVDQHRTARGITVIHRGAPGAAARLLRALRRGQPLGFLPDLPSRVESEPVTFLGRQGSLPSGPARVARRAGVPVVVGWLERKTNNAKPPFTMRVHAIEGLSITTQRIMSALERAIRNSPADWPWMH